MATSRTPYERLNAGRPRRDSTAFQDLNEKLASIEQRLGLKQSASARVAFPEPPAPAQPQGVDSLRDEMWQMKEAIDSLRQHDAPGRDSPRHEDRDDRWSHFEERMDREAQSRNADSEALAELRERLDSIGKDVAGLPQSQSLTALQSDIRSLVETVRGQMDREISESAEGTIAERLDELSRAIVSAQSRPAEVDNSSLERIEARLAALARKAEPQNAGGEIPAELTQRIEFLTERVEALAGRSEAADNAIERIAHHLGALTEHLERSPSSIDLTPVLSTLETRMDSVIASLERSQREARDHSESMFRDLDSRFEKATQSGAMEFSNAATEKALAEIEERLSRLSERMSAEAEENEAERRALLETIDSRLSDLSDRMRGSIGEVSEAGRENFDLLQQKLSDLSEQVENGASGGSEQQSEAIANLENQIAELSSFLTQSREASGEPSSGDTLGLKDELHTLEELSRRTEKRNARTFEAIHETMLKIVDRLAEMEEGRAGPAQPSADSQPADAAQQAARMTIAESSMPAMSEETPASLEEMEERQRSPEADDAAFLREFIDDEPADADMALLHKTMPAPTETGEPMEPGSGAPDLDAAIDRVRAERKTEMSGAERTGSAKADFVAAARRAAQAAASEAETDRDRSTGKSSRKSSRFGGVRPSLLLAVITIFVLVGGYQIYRTFFDQPEQQVAEIAAAEPVSTAPEIDDTAIADEETMPADAGNSQAEDVAVNESAEAADTLAPAPAAPDNAEQETNIEEPGTGPSLDAGAEIDPSADAGAETAEAGTDAEPAEAEVERSIEFGNPALQAAVAEGDPAAWYEVGARYAEGRGVTADMEMAADWFLASAEAGYVPAQYRTALSFEKAIGVERDPQRAVEWYQRAAAADNASAMHNLAVLYAQGAVGAPDNQAARQWFVEAAEHGVRDSQFNLGILNAKGVGEPQDLLQSYKWFGLAAKNGDTDAADKRDEVAKALTDEQLERARGMVELWKPKPLDPAVNQHLPDPQWLDEKKQSTASVDMKKAILNIQGILNNNGYDAGAPDGIMGAKTKAAIREFQTDKGMEPTGEIDQALVKALLSLNAEKAG